MFALRNVDFQLQFFAGWFKAKQKIRKCCAHTHAHLEDMPHLHPRRHRRGEEKDLLSRANSNFKMCQAMGDPEPEKQWKNEIETKRKNYSEPNATFYKEQDYAGKENSEALIGS